MKNLFGTLMILLLFVGMGYSQDPAKALKEAQKALTAFNLDQAGNIAKLGEAVTDIEIAVADQGEVGKSFKAWQTRAEIYNAFVRLYTIRKNLGQDVSDLPKVEDPAIKAFAAEQKCLELGTKKWMPKKALEMMFETQKHLSNMGYFANQEESNEIAFTNFNDLLKAHDILKENKKESTLDLESDYKDMVYFTALSAMNYGNHEAAKPLLEKLVAEGTDRGPVYEFLYQIALGKNPDDFKANADAAYTYLAKGREALPDDVSLLFAEINHYLKLNKMDVLLGKLDLAIAKEPDNVSLYTTKGNVYDNLYQTKAKEGDTDKAQEYFDLALETYKQALSKDSEDYIAQYSIGALYFNKAAAMTTEMNELGTSNAELKKYDALKADSDVIFKKALPYFKKAEMINPNDLNTMIAIKEITARLGDYETSNTFKARLEKVQGGEEFKESYYKN